MSISRAMPVLLTSKDLSVRCAKLQNPGLRTQHLLYQAVNEPVIPHRTSCSSRSGQWWDYSQWQMLLGSSNRAQISVWREDNNSAVRRLATREPLDWALMGPGREGRGWGGADESIRDWGRDSLSIHRVGSPSAQLLLRWGSPGWDWRWPTCSQQDNKHHLICLTLPFTLKWFYVL